MPITQLQDTVGIPVGQMTVAYQNNGSIGTLKILQIVKDFCGIIRIEITGRFIGQYYFGIVHKCASNGCPLAFADTRKTATGTRRFSCRSTVRRILPTATMCWKPWVCFREHLR